MTPPPAHLSNLWPGGTVVCVGMGPSLHREDLALASSTPAVRRVAVNDAYKYIVADALYAADARWWQWQVTAPTLAMPSLLFSAQAEAVIWRPSVRIIQKTGQFGLEDRPAGVRSGGHGGYQALNLAAHLVGDGGKIVLLGYDLLPSDSGEHHAFGHVHPNQSHVRYHQWARAYDTMLEPLAKRRITVINASRQTAITAFPRMPLAQALAH